jgi:hypothetical protein
LLVEVDEPVDTPQLVRLERADKHLRLSDFLDHMHARIGKAVLGVDCKVREGILSSKAAIYNMYNTHEKVGFSESLQSSCAWVAEPLCAPP